MVCVRVVMYIVVFCYMNSIDHNTVVRVCELYDGFSNCIICYELYIVYTTYSFSCVMCHIVVCLCCFKVYWFDCDMHICVLYAIRP